jgi:hypothetical protein
MQDTRWDHALKVTGGGTGLVGHADAVLLRKAADQAGLTAALSAALRKAGTSPLLDRGIVLVSMAAAIALGATSMSDIAVLAHLAPVLGDAPSGPTIRRALDLAGGTAMLERIARARARARAHVWDQFVFAATHAANGRDAILFAPSLPARPLHPPTSCSSPGTARRGTQDVRLVEGQFEGRAVSEASAGWPVQILIVVVF